MFNYHFRCQYPSIYSYNTIGSFTVDNMLSTGSYSVGVSSDSSLLTLSVPYPSSSTITDLSMSNNSFCQRFPTADLSMISAESSFISTAGDADPSTNRSIEMSFLSITEFPDIPIHIGRTIEKCVRDYSTRRIVLATISSLLQRTKQVRTSMIFLSVESQLCFPIIS